MELRHGQIIRKCLENNLIAFCLTRNTLSRGDRSVMCREDRVSIGHGSTPQRPCMMSCFDALPVPSACFTVLCSVVWVLLVYGFRIAKRVINYITLFWNIGSGVLLSTVRYHYLAMLSVVFLVVSNVVINNLTCKPCGDKYFFPVLQ